MCVGKCFFLRSLLSSPFGRRRRHAAPRTTPLIKDSSFPTNCCREFFFISLALKCGKCVINPRRKKKKKRKMELLACKRRRRRKSSQECFSIPLIPVCRYQGYPTLLPYGRMLCLPPQEEIKFDSLVSDISRTVQGTLSKFKSPIFSRQTTKCISHIFIVHGRPRQKRHFS